MVVQIIFYLLIPNCFGIYNTRHSWSTNSMALLCRLRDMAWLLFIHPGMSTCLLFGHRIITPRSIIIHFLQIPSSTTFCSHPSFDNHPTFSISLQFPSLPSIVESSGLDLFNIEIIHPPQSSSQSSSVLQPIVHYVNGPSLSHALIHKRFGHISDDIIDYICAIFKHWLVFH
jgi:hypothetical protein